jgi:hypothetical protein
MPGGMMSGCSPAPIMRPSSLVNAITGPIWRFERHQRCRPEPQTSWLQARLKGVARYWTAQNAIAKVA